MNNFGTQDVFTLHIKKNPRNKEISPTCEACQKGFVHVDTLEVRKFTQSGKLPGVCRSCNAQFLKVCRDQIRAMHQAATEPTVHECELCGRSFSHAGNYNKHKKLHEAAKKANRDTVRSLGTATQKFNLQIDGLNVDGVKIEKPEETGPVVEREDATALNLEVESEVSTTIDAGDPDAQLACLICEKVCSSRTQLKCHLTRCEKRRPSYMCHFCEKSFSTKSGLKSHMSSHVPAAETHVCKFCKEEFLIAEELEQHLLKHLDEHLKPVKAEDKLDRSASACADCGKEFSHIGALRNHMQVHSKDVKKYECQYCSKQYIQSFRFLKHMKECRRDATNFFCKICSKEFDYMKSFKRHKLLHKKSKTD